MNNHLITTETIGDYKEIREILKKSGVAFKSGVLLFGVAKFFEVSREQWIYSDLGFKLRNIEYSHRFLN